jgi:hypothetical protein
MFSRNHDKRDQKENTLPAICSYNYYNIIGYKIIFISLGNKEKAFTSEDPHIKK